MKRLFSNGCLILALLLTGHSAGGGWSAARTEAVDPRAPRHSSVAIIANIYFGDEYEETAPVETEFYLLDRSLIEILKAARFEPEFPDGQARQTTAEDYLEAVAKAFTAAPASDDVEAGVIHFLIKDAMLPHQPEVVRTNRVGRGNFKRVKTGKYYLFGVGRTEAEIFVWHLPVQIKSGDDSIAVDQTNAVIFTADE